MPSTSDAVRFHQNMRSPDEVPGSFRLPQFVMSAEPSDSISSPLSTVVLRGGSTGHRSPVAQKMSSEAMNRRASSMGRMVRPNGPALVQRSFHSDQ